MFIKNNKGLTLIEVVVSIGLAAIVIVSIIVVVAENAGFSVRIDKVYTCSTLARKRIEDIKRLVFSDLEDSSTEINVRVNADGQVDANGGYLRTTEIVPSYDSNTYLAKVKVSVDKMIDGKASGYPVVEETLFADVN